ncbi:uncharacterized protein LOC141621117 [Silene latifolia]|uniref:uncharacterized protein LOC141621117 n=1 Tax=Silene latifolia TaxID=37657 RepID=UPI003D77D23D
MATIPITRNNPTHMVPIFRPESGTWYQPYGELQANYLEKRQLFLRSYQFSRKQSFGAKLKRSLVRVKRLFWVRVRSARRLRRLVWSDLRKALYVKRRRLSRLVNYYYNAHCSSNNNTTKKYNYEIFHTPNNNSCSSYFW